MSEPKHTPEPWAVVDSWEDAIPVAKGGEWDSIFFQSGNYDIPTCTRANAERIVSCVNACAGMEDPEKEIAKLRANQQVLVDALEEIAVKYKTKMLCAFLMAQMSR
jgi:hypothetical protein